MNSYAGFWIRTKAFFFDYLVILIYLIILTAAFLLINQASDLIQLLFASRISAQVSGFLLVTLPISLYFAVGESSIRRATWGKQRLKLMVTNQNGDRVSFWRAFIRTLLKFIPWELSHTLIWELYFSPDASSPIINYGFVMVYVLIGLNIASLIITSSHQTLYDFLTKTYVRAGSA